MNLEIVEFSKITKKELTETVKLDHHAFNIPEEEQISADQCFEWYKRNNKSTILLKDTDLDKIVGYIGILPINKKAYKKIRSGKMIDVNIKDDWILDYSKPGYYNVYITGIVIDEEYRNTNVIALSKLISGVGKLLKSLAFNGHYIKHILADVISQSGERLSKIAGLKCVRKSNHNSYIYELNLLNENRYQDLFKYFGHDYKEILTWLYKEKIKSSQLDLQKICRGIWRGIRKFGHKLKHIFYERGRNKRLLKKYPFLRYHPECSYGFDAVPYFEKHLYETTFLDDMPIGWRKAFGIQMCEEIREELIRVGDDWLNKYSLCQVKEKYGGLRWYDNGSPENSKIDEIIEKYEELYEKVCINCGRPTEYMTTGWISFICNKCASKIKDKKMLVKISELDKYYEK